MTTARFRTARDFLLRHRADYDTAARAFRWPTLERFNWALDWFDAELASGRNADRIALRLVGEKDSACSFAELSERSNRVANGLRELGVARGDRLLLMLGNTEPLWVTMLAAMKLGAVVIPATTLLTADDVLDRIGRGGVRHLVAAASDAAKLDAVAGDVTRIALGEAAGIPSPRCSRPKPTSPRIAQPRRTTRCCSTSHPARRRSQSSCCTRIRAIRLGISRPCIKSACSLAMCI
jgi:acetyl-CoA synthetase